MSHCTSGTTSPPGSKRCAWPRGRRVSQRLRLGDPLVAVRYRLIRKPETEERDPQLPKGAQPRDGGSGCAIPKGAGPASSVARNPPAPAAGARILERTGRGVTLRQRPSNTRNGPRLCPRARTVGTVGSSVAVPSHSLWAVLLSYVPRRIRCGAAPG